MSTKKVRSRRYWLTICLIAAVKLALLCSRVWSDSIDSNAAARPAPAVQGNVAFSETGFTGSSAAKVVCPTPDAPAGDNQSPAATQPGFVESSKPGNVGEGISSMDCGRDRLPAAQPGSVKGGSGGVGDGDI